MEISKELIENFAKGNGAIFIGAGLSIGAGLPGWPDLMKILAEEISDCPPNASYQDIAQFYMLEFNKNRLVKRLREELDTYDLKPTVIHELLAKISISPIFTTNFDDLFEQALRFAKVRFDTVINSADTSFWSSDRAQVVKLHGDLNQPDTVVFTSEDYERYFSDHPTLTRLLAITLQTRTVLFVGYSVTDPDFRMLLTQVQSELGAYARNAFAILFDAPKLIIKDMEKRGIHVINLISDGAKAKNDLLKEWLEEFKLRLDQVRSGSRETAPSEDIKLPEEPYKFLYYFSQEDAAIFHGRDYETAPGLWLF